MKVLLTLHLIAAVFLIGPLVAAGMSGIRYARVGDAGALRSCARMVGIYGWASLAVLFFGAGLVQGRGKGDHLTFGTGWVAASLALFLLAFGLTVGVLRPALDTAVERAEAGEPTAPVVGRIAAVAGVTSLMFLVITVLMVYRP